MTEILVDTSILVDVLENSASEEAKTWLRNYRASISIITCYELTRFLYKTGRASEAWRIKDRLLQHHIRPLTMEICQRAASISHSSNLSMADALIYATAQQSNLRLVTSDSDLKGKIGVVYAPTAK